MDINQVLKRLRIKLKSVKDRIYCSSLNYKKNQHLITRSIQKKPQGTKENNPKGIVNDPRTPPWRELIAKDGDLWNSALLKSNRPNQKKVLIANNLVGYHNGSVVESLLAAALTLRGANVDILVCQGMLSACLNLKIKNIKDWKDIPSEEWKNHPSNCLKCKKFRTVFSDLGLNVIDISDHISKEELELSKKLACEVKLEEIRNFQFEGCSLGEHAYAGCLRYFAMGDASFEEGYVQILRKYFESALQTYFATKNLMIQKKYDVAVFHHGIYIPQGIVGEVCRKHEVRVVNWNPAYRKKCFIFSHDNTYHHTLMNEDIEQWARINFSSKLKQQTVEYLNDRTQGKKDWIWFHNEPNSEKNLLVKETNIDLNKPIVGLLTNVIWDAQLHYPKNAFSSMLDWLIKTIDYFSKRPDLQLLIRVHPAEIRGMTPSRQNVVNELKKHYKVLPKNIFVIGPESEISTYSSMELCNSVIIYGTKTGVELTSRGIPVIVAGEAWIKNKGLTLDANSAEEYYRILDSLPLKKNRLSDHEIDLAQKYAFHFFFRRMIPIECFVPLSDGKKMPFEVKLDSLSELKQGVDKGLDVICDGILTNSPFVYKYETIET